MWKGADSEDTGIVPRMVGMCAGGSLKVGCGGGSPGIPKKVGPGGGITWDPNAWDTQGSLGTPKSESWWGIAQDPNVWGTQRSLESLEKWVLVGDPLGSVKSRVWWGITWDPHAWDTQGFPGTPISGSWWGIAWDLDTWGTPGIPKSGSW